NDASAVDQAGLPDPGERVVGVLIELAATTMRFGRALAALAGARGSIGPVGLGEHRVERLDVRLDGRGDDVRVPGLAVVQALGTRALTGRRLDRDDDEALGFRPLG